jgi:isoleucyl-tRNA synthetase
VRELCRAFANEQVERQKKDFIRLGVLGEWDNPYLTMAFKTEADEIRALGKILDKGYLYQGLKPVNWCLDCGSALAEAEVEYEDKTSHGDRRRLRSASQPRRQGRQGLRPHPPARPGLRRHLDDDAVDAAGQRGGQRPPGIHYDLIETPKGALILVRELADACLKRYALEGTVVGSAKGARSNTCCSSTRSSRATWPSSAARTSPLEAGTGLVHTAPAHGADDYLIGKVYGLPVNNPVGDDGRSSPARRRCRRRWPARPSGKPTRWCCRNSKPRPPAQGSKRSSTATRTAGATRRRSSSAPRRSGSSAWTTRTRKTPPTLRWIAERAVDETQFFPAWGRARLEAMMKTRPDWCVSRQRNWGVPIPFFLHKETGALHPRTAELIEAVALRVEKAGIEAWFSLDAKELLGDEADQYRKMKDTLDVWFDSGVTHSR